MSFSRYQPPRKNGKIPVPGSGDKPFPRIHARRTVPEKSGKSASNTNSRESKGSARDKSSRRSSANDSDYSSSRYDSANSSSINSDDTNDRSIRSPIECQCSCHDREGRKRSTSRGRRRSDDSIHDRNGNRHSDSGDDGDGRMPPININDKRASKSNKGSYFGNDPSSRYHVRSGSKTSRLSITSVSSDRKNRDKPPFKYYGGGRSLSTGDLRNAGKGIKNDYDYAREDFLTPRFTSEYTARYDMRHGQRYTVGSDKIIHYIDPAGEHILVPKDSSQMKRSVSDSDIQSSVRSRNNRNVKLEPLDKRSMVNGSKGTPPAETTSDNRQWMPARKPTTYTLPPMQKTPTMPDTSRPPTRSQDMPHPLGLNTPPKRNSQLYPM